MATCNLVNCVPITPEFVASLSEQEKAFGDYTIGRFAWILDDVKALDKLVPVKGAQRLWELDERILELAGVATMTAPERILGGRTWEEFPDPQG
jgi:hypothetical protein